MPSPNQIIHWEEFLKEHGCSGVVDFGDWAMCYCPFHTQSDRSRPSFGINKESGMGNCFGCGTHDWEEICNKFGIDSLDTIEGMRESMWDNLRKRIHGEKTARKYLRYNLPDQLINPYSHKGSLKYINDRHISKEMIERFGIRTCIDKSSKYFEYLIIPIYDDKGLVIR
jgi:DNA primase